MIIVSGAIYVDPDERTAYLKAHRDVIDAARSAAGCLDFALSVDEIEPGRINVYERWESDADVERFRGDGPSPDDTAQMLSADVSKYRISSTEDP